MDCNNNLPQRDYREDFPFYLRLIDAAGNPLAIPEDNWDAVFFTDRVDRGFKASHRDGEYTNAAPMEDGRLRFVVDGHALMPGKMRMIFTLYKPDAAFPDGVRTITVRKTFDFIIGLHNGTPTTAEIEATLPVIRANVMANEEPVFTEILDNINTALEQLIAGELGCVDTGSKSKSAPAMRFVYGMIPIYAQPGFLYRNLGYINLRPDIVHRSHITYDTKGLNEFMKERQGRSLQLSDFVGLRGSKQPCADQLSIKADGAEFTLTDEGNALICNFQATPFTAPKIHGVRFIIPENKTLGIGFDAEGGYIYMDKNHKPHLCAPTCCVCTDVEPIEFISRATMKNNLGTHYIEDYIKNWRPGRFIVQRYRRSRTSDKNWKYRWCTVKEETHRHPGLYRVCRELNDGRRSPWRIAFVGSSFFRVIS